MKRLRTGGVKALLQANPDVDMFHIGELRHEMKLSNPETWELRKALETLGFREAIWNWCTDNPGLHGSATLSKIRSTRSPSDQTATARTPKAER